MTPRLFRKLAGGNASGGSALAKMRGWATNMQSENYYGSNYSMANLVVGNGAEGFDSAGSYHDTDLWLQSVPNGGVSFDRRIVFGLSGSRAYFPPGAYMVATRQGMYCTVRDDGGRSFFHATQQGIDSPTQSARNALFTVDNLGADGNYAGLILTVTVKTPASGGPFNCKDLYVGLVSDYPAWLAGQVCSAAFLADMQGCAAMKHADWTGMNSQSSVKFTISPAQLISPTRSYQGTQNRSYGIAAKQCGEVGAINWPVLPYVYEDYLYSCDSATNTIKRTSIPGGGFSTLNVGDQIALYGGHFQDGVPHEGVQGGTIYYIVQKIDADTYRVSLTPGGAPVTISGNYSGVGDYSALIALVLDPYPVDFAIAQQIKAASPSGIVCPQSCLEPWNGGYYYELIRQVGSIQAGAPYNAGRGYGYRVMRLWKAFEAVFPRSQYIRIVEQWGLGSAGFDTLGDALNYVSTDPDFYPGKSVKDLMDCFSTNAYPHFVANGDSNGNEVTMLIAYGPNPTVSQWSAASRLAIDNYAATATSWRARADAVRPHTPAIMYEAGLGEGMFYRGFDAANVAVSAVNVGSPGSFTASWLGGGSGAWPTNLPIAITSTGTVPGGLSAQPYYYVHSSSTATNLVLSATRGGAPANITSSGSGTISVNGGTGQQYVDIFASYAAYLASAQYSLDLKYFLDTVIVGGFKCRAMAIYSLAGGQGYGTSYGSFWGSKRDCSVADTPATAMFKGYTSYIDVP